MSYFTASNYFYKRLKIISFLVNAPNLLMQHILVIILN